MPCIEIVGAQICQKAAKAQHATPCQYPPRPHVACLEGKLSQPQIQQANCKQRATKRDAVMNHKANHSALVNAAELISSQAKKSDIVWQELIGQRKKQRKGTGEGQTDASE